MFGVNLKLKGTAAFS